MPDAPVRLSQQAYETLLEHVSDMIIALQYLDASLRWLAPTAQAQETVYQEMALKTDRDLRAHVRRSQAILALWEAQRLHPQEDTPHA